VSEIKPDERQPVECVVGMAGAVEDIGKQHATRFWRNAPEIVCEVRSRKKNDSAFARHWCR
jgi:hypothetical protein